MILSDLIYVLCLQLNNERNFHIFYRLLAGMSSADLAKLHLVKDATQYSYLTKVSLNRLFLCAIVIAVFDDLAKL